MTRTLNDVMREQADARATPYFDTDAIVSAGNRRLRRTRAAVGALAVAAVTLTAVGLPQLLDGAGTTGADGLVAGQGREAVGAFAERRPTYAVDDLIYYGKTQIDVAEKIGSFVQTDDGFVYATDDGKVHLADADTTEEIGHTSRDGLYLKADDTGSLVTWVEFTEGEAPALVAYDTAKRQEALRTEEGTKPGMTAFRDTDSVYVYAVDDGTVYWRNARGLVATDVASRTSTVLDKDANPFQIADVANGRFAHQVLEPEGGDTRIRVSTDLHHPAQPLPTGYDSGYLSPSARYVVTDEQDEMAVYDTATREDVTPNVPGYRFAAGYAWLDDQTLTVIGLEGAHGVQPIDILQCAVPAGDCAVVADDVTTYDSSRPIRLALPVGERLD